MNVYLVRTIEEKTAYGIFWAEDLRDLFMVIDEKDDPSALEYLLLTERGGLFFVDGVAEWKLGVTDKPGSCDPDWEDDEGAYINERMNTVAKNITFSLELTADVLSGRVELSGFVPWSELGE